MEAARALLGGILDYAGQFPPARLPFERAVRQYYEHQRHPHHWLLARYALPLEDLARADHLPRVTLICRGDNLRLPVLPPNVECVEVAGSLAEPCPRFVFQELDWGQDLADQFRRLAPGQGAKLRTGGLVQDAVPPADKVAIFLWQAARFGVPVKFTAGLHHALPRDGQHGFLNVFAAALAAFEYQAPTDALESLLTEMTIRFAGESFSAGRYEFHLEALRRLRSTRVISFGSCSFLEPVEELEALRIL